MARALELSGGSDEEIRTAYRKALDFAPASAAVLSDYGRFLQETGSLVQAEEIYRVAIEEEAWSKEAHNGLAAVLMSVGRLEEADAAAAEAVRLDPDYVDALTNLGMVRARAGNLVEAERLLRRAVFEAQKVGNVIPVFNLALILMETGNFEDAVGLLRQSVRADPANEQARVLLARAFLEIGDKPSALAHLDALLQIDPGNEGALAMKAQIEGGN
jgi:Tfp pilus assembly protein PilF